MQTSRRSGLAAHRCGQGVVEEERQRLLCRLLGAVDAVPHADAPIGGAAEEEAGMPGEPALDGRQTVEMPQRVLRHALRPTVDPAELRLRGDAHYRAQLLPHQD